MNILNIGTGTQVRDLLAPVLFAAATDITSATTTTGSWVAVDHPCHASVELLLSVATGAGNTANVEIQGSDEDTGSPADLVSYGRFTPQVAADIGVPHNLDVVVYKRLMRAVVVSSGTVTALNLAVTVRDRDYKRDENRTA